MITPQWIAFKTKKEYQIAANGIRPLIENNQSGLKHKKRKIQLLAKLSQ